MVRILSDQLLRNRERKREIPKKSQVSSVLVQYE